MFAAFTTGRQRSISAARCVSSAAREAMTGSPPSFSSRAFTSKPTASALLISALSLSAIAGSMPAGPVDAAYHWSVFEARIARLGDGRQLREGSRALGARDTERAKTALLGKRHDHWRAGETHLQLATQQVAHEGRGALVGHVQEFRAGGIGEIGRGEMRGRCRPAGAIGQRAGLCLGESDQVLNRGRRHVGGVHRQHVGHVRAVGQSGPTSFTGS